ncbi:MAG: DUF2306 domain-containing protein [Bacteroidetes bacterium]|nr:DUF2306 domain-containing protein [Bacteroidota bacterium]
MLLAIVQYADGKLTTGFLAYKQDYISNAFWLGGFYVHVGTSIFCLIAGFTQFSGFIRREFPKIHRGVGKVYIFSILFINFPAGLILAVHANGGLSNRIAFTILALLWFTFTLKAWISIRNKNITEHYRFMVRSYALTFSAITLRLWKLVFIELTDWDEMFIYQVDAWLGFGLNILIAELYLLSKKSLSD